MRVDVAFDECDGNGMCVLAAPEIFELAADDVLHVRVEHPAPELWPVAEEAMRACPKFAIVLHEEN